MQQKRFNWPLWTGLLLCVAAFLTYFTVFVNYPVTRDVPWVNYALFVLALVLLVTGWRRAPKKVLASIVAVLGVVIAGAFVFAIASTRGGMPGAAGSPAPGQKAPDFTLADTNGKPVTLSQTLAGSNGVLLIFYRGYW
ncbi:MAG TPA: hypothetical protein VF618_06590 [Thermoanaerobaculia bacterium]